jgi:hypothetical protein
MGQGVDGLMQHGLQGLAGAFGQALAGHEQLGLASGRRQVQGGALACFGGRPSTQWSAPKWPHLASMWTAPEDRPVPVTTTTSGSSGVRRRMSTQVCSRAAMSPEPVISMAVMESPPGR